MKIFSPEAEAEIEAGKANGVGAVFIACAPEPVRIWAGYGPLMIAGETFQGIGNHGLVSASGGALGGAAQDVTLTLSGVEPAVLALLDAEALRGAPIVIWRLIFNSAADALLSAPVFTRGRLDQIIIERTPGATASIQAKAEGAAKGLGRARQRMRSDSDQRQDDPTDAGFSATSYAGQKVLYWAGKIPVTANALPGAADVVAGPHERR